MGWIATNAAGFGFDYLGNGINDTMLKNGEISQVYTVTPSGQVVPSYSYRGHKYFQNYSLAQLQSLYELLEKWRELTGINWRMTRDTFKEVFPGNDQLSANAYNSVKGLYTHNSFRTDKTDIMPQKEILEMLLTGKKPTSVSFVTEFEQTPEMR